jgi:hypothetical protein
MNATKEKKTFWLMFTLFLITGPFLVWYLNFREGEVRERDYFFTQNFHFFAIWIGMGVVAMLQAVQDLLGAGAEKAAGTAGGGAPAPAPRMAPVVVGLAALMVGMSVLPLVAVKTTRTFMSMTAAATTWPTASPTTCWWGWRDAIPHERRQRHLPALVSAGGGEFPQGCPRHLPVAPEHGVVHPPDPRFSAEGAGERTTPRHYLAQDGQHIIKAMTGSAHL